ncbi:MAG TPA: sigma-70 family RNA polymerase sigma factor [Candidatus Hydrogenedentes bacterium]|nr:sigma-70 family RNA polymerase sigma factor [Candidatus Hydrogenedentota bacterium]
MNDAECVKRCLAGDADAYAILVRRYQGAVYATAYYYAGRYNAAEDIVQETFWAAYRSLRMLKDPDRFGPWLKSIATRTSVNWLRRHLPRLRRETPLPHRQQRSTEEILERYGPVTTTTDRVVLVDWIRDAIDTLPEDLRLPVVLRFLQEMTYDEMARFLGEDAELTRAKVRRALVLLREVIDPAARQQKDDEEGIIQWPRVEKK